jgi:DNA-binding CsgD family transcriptional regulator
MTTPANPWGLTRCELEVCEALATTEGPHTNARLGQAVGLPASFVADKLDSIFIKMAVDRRRRRVAQLYRRWLKGEQAAAVFPNPWRLTPREAEVVRTITDGHVEDKLIARQLGISPLTVGNHLHVAFRKMGADSRVMAALTYDRWARAAA